MAGMQKVQRLLALITVALAAGPALGQQQIPVELTFVPATAQVNTLDMDVTVDAPAVGSSHDSEVTQVSGIVSALLTVEFNAGTKEAVVSGLEFTGGRYTLTDVTFRLPFKLVIIPLGSITADATGLAGTLDTPVPPGSVSGTTFPAGDHRAILNEGSIHAEGSGTVGDYFDPMDMDLSADPLSAGSEETATLLVTIGSVGRRSVSHDVTMRMPIDMDESLVDPNEGISAHMTAQGTFEARGSFTRLLDLFGDFNGDRKINAADVNLLAGQIPSASPPYDLDGSGAVDGADMDVLIHDVLETEYGDVDLNGEVDHFDYLTVKAALSAPDAAGWTRGDFDGDNDVDSGDLDLLAIGFQAATPAAAAAPEPGALFLLAAVLPVLTRRRSRAGQA